MTTAPLELALRYAQLGWHVVPLHVPRGADGCSCGKKSCARSRGKHPRSNNWPAIASADPVRLKAWFSSAGSNIGIVTGATSGVVVLDIDPEAGGEQSFAALELQHGQFPRTVEQLTGSGGRHLLFKHPGWRVSNSVKKLGAGLDVRGDGGQIVAPPSLHFSGNHYEWQPACAPWELHLAELPAWLADLLKPAPVARALPPALVFREIVEHQVDGLRRASAYLARLPSAVSGQRGHDTTWDVVQKVVRGFALTEPDAYMLLASEYNPRCVPPWSEKELRHKIAQAQTVGTFPMSSLLEAARPSAPPPPVREPGAYDGDPAPTSLWGLQPLELFLERKFPPLEWLYLDLVPAHSACVLVAPPNAGKTLLALDMGAQVTARAAAIGLTVAIVQEEGSGGAFQQRLSRAFAAAGGVRPGTVKVAWNTGRSLMDRSHVNALAKEVRDYGLVVLDSLSALSGGIDENDSQEMARLSEAIYRLKNESGAAVLALHHMTKEAWKPGETPSLRHMRGHGALAARVDTVLALVPLDSDADRVNFELHCIKQRDAERAKPRSVSVAMKGPAATVELEQIGTTAPTTSTENAAVQRTAERILPLFPMPPETIAGRNLYKKVGGRRNRYFAAIRYLLDSDKIIDLGRGELQRIAPDGSLVPDGSQPVPGTAQPVGSHGSTTPKGWNREPGTERNRKTKGDGSRYGKDE